MQERTERKERVLQATLTYLFTQGDIDSKSGEQERGDRDLKGRRGLRKEREGAKKLRLK